MAPANDLSEPPDFDEKLTLEEELSSKEIAVAPNETGDPSLSVETAIPSDIRDKFEVFSYRNAAFILSQTKMAEFDDIMETLRHLSITEQMLLKPGGNESEIPKLFSKALRPRGWHETVIQGDLTIQRTWRVPRYLSKAGKELKNPTSDKKNEQLVRKKFLDGHKIDYVKGRVAFDLEWNSKDQTFDRDLYAFSAFSHCGIVDVAVLVTRSESLNPVFQRLGIKKKYGASTTWMGKLIYRLNAGRNGGCPVLVLGITPKCLAPEPNQQ